MESGPDSTSSNVACVYDIRKMDGIIIWVWTKKSSKIPMKIARGNRWENPVGYPAGRRHASNESN
jgi:hypothetical protein